MDRLPRPALALTLLLLALATAAALAGASETVAWLAVCALCTLAAGVLGASYVAGPRWARYVEPVLGWSDRACAHIAGRFSPLRSLARALAAREWAAAVTGAVALGALLSRSLLTERGVIGMRHDWAPMYFRGQYTSWAQAEFVGWNPIAMGAPSVYPNDWILLLLYRLADGVFDPVTISRLTVVAIPAVAAFGTYALLRGPCRLSIAGSAFGACAAALSPTLFNKMVAGQLAFLWALALLPAWLCCYRKATFAWWLWAGAIAAVISAQVQFSVFIVVLIVCDGALWGDRRWPAFVRAAAVTIGAIVVAQIGTLVALSLNHGGLASSLSSAPSVDWVRSNSPPFESALELRGYVTRYYEWAAAGASELSGLAMAFPRLFVLSVLGGMLVAARWRAGRFAIAVWLLGTWFAAGLNAPASAPVAWLYDHVRLMQLFREVYHWSALATLGATMLLAYLADAVARVLRGSARGLAAVGLAAMLLAFGWPSIDGEWSGQVQTVTVSGELEQTYRRERAADGPARILWWPIDQPLSKDDGGYAGLDPLTWSQPPSMSEYILSRSSSAIVDNIRYGNVAGTNALLRYAGVGTLVYRNELVSHLTQYLYRSNDRTDAAWSGHSDRRGIAQIGWLPELRGDRVDVYHAPYSAAIVATARGIATVSPSEDLLPAVPAMLSPTFDVRTANDAIVVADSDRALFAAGFAEGGRDPFAPGVIFQSGDAAAGWAKVDGWWFYRDEYIRALDVAVLSLRVGSVLALGDVVAGETVVIGTTATPYGGAIRVRVAGRSIGTLGTRAKVPELRSAAFVASQGGRLEIVDERGEAVLRRALILPPGGFARASRSAADALKSTPYLALAIPAGSATTEIPRDGLYAASNVRAIDGRPAGAFVRLRAGAHVVEALPRAFLTTGTLPAPVPPPLDLVVSPDGTRITGRLAAGTGVLVLRSTFEPGWTLRFDDDVGPARHVVGDLFGNAWTFGALPREQRFTVVYRPGELVSAAHELSLVLILIVLAGTVATTGFRRARGLTLRGEQVAPRKGDGLV